MRQLLTLREVAARYGCSVARVRKLAQHGVLPAYRLTPNALRFDPKQLPKRLPRKPVPPPRRLP